VDLQAALDSREYVGRAPQQVDRFCAEMVSAVRRRYAGADLAAAELNV
jgi:hypothetical protein